MKDRDERPLSEIEFARHGANHDLELQTRIREMFKSCGVISAQDIIKIGCTGLVVGLKVVQQVPPGLAREPWWVLAQVLDGALRNARLICENMAGSICGLPCYVPNDRFCLVHNTIGGFQASGNLDGPQVNEYPEGVAVCSRSLTEAERAHFGQIQSKIAQDGLAEAQLFFGAELATEPVSDPLGAKIVNRKSVEAELEEAWNSDLENPACPIPLPPFKCREHAIFNSGCRFCLAQSIAEGPYAPPTFVNSVHINGNCEHVTLDLLPTLIVQESTKELELYVLAARWVRKLVKE